MDQRTEHSDACGRTTGPVAYASAIDGDGVRTIYRLAKCECGFKTEWRVESVERVEKKEA